MPTALKSGELLLSINTEPVAVPVVGPSETHHNETAPPQLDHTAECNQGCKNIQYPISQPLRIDSSQCRIMSNEFEWAKIAHE